MLFVVRFIVFNFILLNQVFAFEDPIIDDLKNKIDEVTEKPSWIFKRITSEDHYFFVGMGSAEDKVEAMKSSRLDALSILSLKVHVSIDQNQVFDSVYASNQDTKNDDSQSFTEKVYNKIQIKTNSLVEGAEFTEYFYEKHRDKLLCYSLLRIKKEDLKKSIDKFKSWREEIKKNPIVVVVYVLDYRGVVYQDLKIQAAIQRFYTLQGYNVIQQFLNSIPILQGNFDVKKICDEILLVNQNVRSLVYAILTMEKFEDENYFSLIGHLNWKKINILDMAIEYNESFDEKAISLNNINVTYSKLMKKIIDRIDIFKSIG